MVVERRRAAIFRYAVYEPHCLRLRGSEDDGGLFLPYVCLLKLAMMASCVIIAGGRAVTIFNIAVIATTVAVGGGDIIWYKVEYGPSWLFMDQFGPAMMGDHSML